VPLALPLMAGPGPSVQPLSGERVTIVHLWVFSGDCAFALCCWGIFRMAPWLVRLLGQTGINVITRIMGLLLMALGIEFIVTGIKRFSRACELTVAARTRFRVCALSAKHIKKVIWRIIFSNV
jgi:small neutral amino acid transporter SnatA (MarC family)